jgi:hypothetical protein
MLPSATDERGFEVRNLPPATYSLSAHTLNGAVGFLHDLPLAAGESRTNLELRVSPGAWVHVTYAGPKPSGGIALVHDGTIVAADGIVKGLRSSFAVPAGRSIARMTLFPEQESHEVAFDLAVGEAKELVFDGAWK